MTSGAAHLSKCSLRKEQTLQPTILDTFSSGVTAALQQAENDEEVWLEVLSSGARNPELYPGGPRGSLTGTFSSLTQGAFFQPSAILKGWGDKGVESFWYSLMGVDRTPYISNEKLIGDAEKLRKCPTAKIDRSTRVWLITAGCIDRQTVNGRWDILFDLFDNTVTLERDETQVLSLFRRVSSKTEACRRFCSDGSSPESFEDVYANIKRRKWLTSIVRNTSFTLNSRGLQALNTGKWLKQINRGK